MIKENKLRKLYWEKNLSQRDIAETLNCSRSNIKYWMNKYNIPTRGNFSDWSVDELDEQALRLHYKKKEWSQKMIAEKYNCSRKTVGNRLEKFGIEKRDHSKSLELAYSEKRRKRVKMFGKENPFHGEEHTEETRKKMSQSAKERVKRNRGNQLCPNYNPDACELIEEYGKKHGYDFQHAENGGEFFVKGYWLDGYDLEANVAIEVDESHHFDENGELCEYDKNRQREIECELDCEFIRLRANS